MRHLGHILALSAAALVGSTMIAGTAHAQTSGYYVATPAAQPTAPRLMTRATPWALQGNSYHAARAPERDTVLCDLVARNTGALSGFTVGGKAFDDAQLAKCNAHAKGGVGAAASVAAR